MNQKAPYGGIEKNRGGGLRVESLEIHASSHPVATLPALRGYASRISSVTVRKCKRSLEAEKSPLQEDTASA